MVFLKKARWLWSLGFIWLLSYVVLAQDGARAYGLGPRPVPALDNYIFLVGSALRCYVCDGIDHLCTVGLLGEKTECPSGTKNCYKSWTGECSATEIAT